MRTFILGAACAALLTGGCDRQSASQSQATPAAAEVAGLKLAARPGEPGLDRSQAGKPMPAADIVDGEGNPTTLAAAAGGKPLLLNLWATWCAPCVKELPTLDALTDRPGAPQVMALSQDTQGQDKVAAFLAERKVGLEAYQDKDMAVSSALGAQILPTTTLYGSDGKEVWRYTGDLDWTSDIAAPLLREAR